MDSGDEWYPAFLVSGDELSDKVAQRAGIRGGVDGAGDPHGTRGKPPLVGVQGVAGSPSGQGGGDGRGAAFPVGPRAED